MVEERLQTQTELLVSDRALQKHRPKPLQTVLGSIPDKDVFCRSETERDRRMAPRTKLFVPVRKLQEQRPQPYLSWVCLVADGF
jgi:hypothetical protein